MKKILIIFILFLFSVTCFAQNLQVDSNNYTNNNLIEKDKFGESVNNALRGVELKNNEFIVLAGKLSKNNELSEYKVDLLNISDEKANSIIQKLTTAHLFYDNNSNEIFTEFKLYIGTKPEYEIRSCNFNEFVK